MSFDKKSIRPITVDQNGEFCPVVTFDCRGIAPVEPTLFGTKWNISSAEGGSVFNDVELNEEWADYDTKNDCAVSILEPEIKVE